jgi:hypothetical protein
MVASVQVESHQEPAVSVDSQQYISTDPQQPEEVKETEEEREAAS